MNVFSVKIKIMLGCTEVNRRPSEIDGKNTTKIATGDLLGQFPATMQLFHICPFQIYSRSKFIYLSIISGVGAMRGQCGFPNSK